MANFLIQAYGAKVFMTWVERAQALSSVRMTYENTKLYEIRLLGPACKGPILFNTAVATDEEAADYARRVLQRHPERSRAEVWCGMKLVRQV